MTYLYLVLAVHEVPRNSIYIYVYIMYTYTGDISMHQISCRALQNI